MRATKGLVNGLTYLDNMVIVLLSNYTDEVVHTEGKKSSKLERWDGFPRLEFVVGGAQTITD